MSSLDPEKEYDNFTDAFRKILEQFSKTLWVCIPGIIESYDSGSKRCRVRPAINVRKTDGSTSTPSPIVNVPVVWPSGGGFSLISPLPEGEPVEIRFSQRGITQFKEIFAQADPGNGIFSKEDAIVQPGFGGLEITPATEDGISMQSDDGLNYLYIEDGIIKVKSTTKIINEAPEIELNASTKITLSSPIIDVTENINMITGTIGGPNVFNGASGHDHAHDQDNDSADNTQVKTDGPS